MKKVFFRFAGVRDRGDHLYAQARWFVEALLVRENLLDIGEQLAALEAKPYVLSDHGYERVRIFEEEHSIIPGLLSDVDAYHCKIMFDDERYARMNAELLRVLENNITLYLDGETITLLNTEEVEAAMLYHCKLLPSQKLITFSVKK